MDMVRMIVVLSLLCGLSGFALSYLKMVTAAPIEEQLLNNVQGPSLEKVFAHAENSPIADRRKFTLGDRTVTVFPAMQGGKLVGAALEEKGKGYGGDIGVMVGFNIENDSLANIGITTLKETPGLGMRVTEPDFYSQFGGCKTPVALSDRNGEIDAVSGATVSSNGVITAVNKAAATYKSLKPQILKAWSGPGALPPTATPDHATRTKR